MVAIDRRTRIADAIIATLAESGSRGLTHRAVDQAAGLPAGSTSYYLRSRAALFDAAVARLADLDAEAVAGAHATDPAAALTALMQEALTGDGRRRTLARYELSLEAVRRPELRRALADGTGRLEAALADRLDALMPDVDAGGRAADLLAYVDGILFAEITGTRPAPRSAGDLRAAAEWILGATTVSGSVTGRTRRAPR